MEISHGKHLDAGDVPAYEFSPVEDKFLVARGRPVLGDENEHLGAVVAVEDITALKVLDRLKSEVKGLLNDLGGSVSVENAPGEGSVFTVSIPVKKQCYNSATDPR